MWPLEGDPDAPRRRTAALHRMVTAGPCKHNRRPTHSIIAWQGLYRPIPSPADGWSGPEQGRRPFHLESGADRRVYVDPPSALDQWPFTWVGHLHAAKIMGKH